MFPIILVNRSVVLSHRQNFRNSRLDRSVHRLYLTGPLSTTKVDLPLTIWLRETVQCHPADCYDTKRLALSPVACLQLDSLMRLRSHSKLLSMETQAHESASTVFATPELVEQILLYLPLLDQFVAMRVNILCRNIVQTAVVIRRKMQLVHARDGTQSSLERRTDTHPTRFFLGDSSALFETSPFFLSGLGSLFYGVTHRGLYKGCALSSSKKCSLHLDIAPFYFTGINQSSDADFRHIEITFRCLRHGLKVDAHPPRVYRRSTAKYSL
jgi:hypothetical protein